jgi:hypothetical protein
MTIGPGDAYDKLEYDNSSSHAFFPHYLFWLHFINLQLRHLQLRAPVPVTLCIAMSLHLLAVQTIPYLPPPAI